MNELELLIQQQNNLLSKLISEKSETQLSGRYASAAERFMNELLELQKDEDKKLSDRQATINGLNGQLSDKQATIDGLNRQLSDKQATIDGLNRQLADRQATIDGLNRQLADRQATIDGLNGQLADRQATIDGLNGQLADRQATIDGLNGQLADKQATIDGLNRQLSDKQNALDALKSKYDDAFQMYKELRKSICGCKSMEKLCETYNINLDDDVESIVRFICFIGSEYSMAINIYNSMRSYKFDNNFPPLSPDELNLMEAVNNFYKKLYNNDKDAMFIPKGFDVDNPTKSVIFRKDEMENYDRSAHYNEVNTVCVPGIYFFNDEKITLKAIVGKKG